MRDYDVPFECACCGNKSTNYLCGKCMALTRDVENAALRAEVERLTVELQLSEYNNSVVFPAAAKVIVKRDAELKRLRAVIEWACGDDTGDFYKCEHYLTWKRELRRKAEGRK